MTFKEYAYECEGCGAKLKALRWDYDPVPPCSVCGASMHETSIRWARNAGVIDDQIEGGPRVFETMGHEGVYIESKSQWRREVAKRGLTNVVKHDSAYYAKQRRMLDEERRDTGSAR